MPITQLPPRETVVAACARALRSAILAGEYKPGTRLPPERTLAASFGVNRVTIRAALAQLESARLVSVRQGSGYLVRDYRRDGGMDLLPAVLEVSRERGDLADSLSDLLRVRRSLASAVLEKVMVRNRDKEGWWTPLSEAVDRFETVAASGDPARLAQADVDVLSVLLDLTGSSVLGLCLNPVVAILSAFPPLREAIYSEPMGNVLAYRAVIAVLAGGDVATIGLIVNELAKRDESNIEKIRHLLSASPVETAPVEPAPSGEVVAGSALAVVEPGATEAAS